jgi:hypothetical protein
MQLFSKMVIACARGRFSASSSKSQKQDTGRDGGAETSADLETNVEVGKRQHAVRTPQQLQNSSTAALCRADSASCSRELYPKKKALSGFKRPNPESKRGVWKGRVENPQVASIC